MFSAEQSQAMKQSQLNKRRRFAPNTLPLVAPDNASPLINELCDQSSSQQEIEAQLLQVGMRVRKSVNDGYQTITDTLSALQNTSQNKDNSAGGLHNVGGFAMQSLRTATFCGIDLAMMAHISCATPIEEQKLWSYSTSSKRRQHFEEDSDSDDSQEFMPRTPQLEYADACASYTQDYFHIEVDTMSETSPFTQVREAQPKFPNRRLALPKSRVRSMPQEPVQPANPFAQISAPAKSFGDHRGMISCGTEAKMDFGEASFLQPQQDIEMENS